MTISLAPVGIADPPAPPSAASSTRNGPSFGQFIDNANAQPTGSAGSGSGATAPRDDTHGNPAPTAANPANQPAQPPSSQNPPAVGEPAGKGSGKSSSSGRHASADDGKIDGPNGAQHADAIALPVQLALASPIPPIAVPVGNASTSTSSAHASADKTLVRGAPSPAGDTQGAGASSRIGPRSMTDGAWQAAVATANAKTDGPAVATPGANAALAASPGDLPGTPKTEVTNAVASADAAILAAPPVAGTVTPPVATPGGSTAPAAGLAGGHNPSGTVSAQAAALATRLSATGTAQAPAAAAPPSGSGGTLASSSAAHGSVAVLVAVPSTPAAAPTDPVPVPTMAAGSPPAASGTPLPPVSATVDLATKFSATAIVPRGEGVTPAAAKPKTDAHVTASATTVIASRPVPPAGPTDEGVVTAATARPVAETSPGAAAQGEADGTRADEAVGASATTLPAVNPQPRADAAGIQGGAPATAPMAASAAPVAAVHSVVDQVAISLKRGVKSGNDQIMINLEPASLGKIAVRLDFSQDGRVAATFSADRPDTLTLLNTDSRALEQSLRDAGLRADSGSLTFNLSGGDGGASARQSFQSASYVASAAAMAESDPLAPLAATKSISMGLSHDGSLDIHV